MAQTIKLKRSATQGAVPSTSSLALGELAINTYDGKIFIKKDDGSEAIVTIGELSDNSVTAAKIATGAVGASELASTGVTAGSYGSSSAIPVVTVDADGRVTSLTTASISGLSANSVTATEIATGAVGASEIAANSVGISELNVTDGSSGQVLKTDGAGNLSFGDGGGATSQSFNVNTATGDGSTTDFTLSTTPSSEAMIIAFIDGVFQNQDSYTFSGTTLSFDTAPGNGTTVTVYVVGSIYSGNSVVLDTFSGDGSTTAFTLTQNPQNENNTQIYIDGVYQQKSQYSVSGTTLTFSSAPPSGTSNIEVIAFTSTNFSVLNANSVTSASIAANSVGTSELDMANITFSTLDVATTTTDDSVTITTTEDSSAAAPVITLKRNSASPADADYLGQIKFKGENDADQEVVYGKITGKIGDNTDTTEDGIIEFANIKDGTQTITVRLKSDEMQLLNSTGLNVAGTTVLSGLTYPTSDGTNGQYLQTNGSGTLSFSTVSGYTDSDVETYLNTSEIYTDATNNYLGVGSGASTPSHVFHVQKSVANGTLVKLQNASNTASDVLLLNTAGTGSGTNILDVQASGSSKFLVRGDGNVGIGTTSPANLLHLESSGSDFATIRLNAPSNTTPGQFLLRAHDGVFDIRNVNNSTTDLTIDASGNVGIGATPSAYNSSYKAIDINNSASVMGYNGNNGAWLLENLYYGSDNNWKHKNTDFSAALEMYDGVFNFYNTASGTAGTTATLNNRLTINASGNVGIGTSNPSSKLTLLNNTQDGTTLTRQYATFGPSNSWLDSDTVGWAGAGLGEVQIHNGTANRPPILSLGGSLAAGELLGAVNFFRSSNTDTYRQRAYIASGLTSSGTADQYGADLRFATAADGATSPSTRMTITSSGSVIIDTDTNSRFTIGDGGNNAITLYGGSGDELYVGANATYKLRFKTDGNIVMDNGGAFGIGTSTPTSGVALDVQNYLRAGNLYLGNLGGTHRLEGGNGHIYPGDMRLTAGATNMNIDFQVVVTGVGISTEARLDSPTGDWYTNDGSVSSLSDERVKTDITDLSDGLEIVKQLRPVTFKYNDNSEDEYGNKLMGAARDKVRYGFIAQEVEQVAPQYVETGIGYVNNEEVDDFKSMSTTRMIPMLFKAVQELNTKLEAAEARITELEG